MHPIGRKSPERCIEILVGEIAFFKRSPEAGWRITAASAIHLLNNGRPGASPHWRPLPPAHTRAARSNREGVRPWGISEAGSEASQGRTYPTQ